MTTCKQCGSQAINHQYHGRDSSDPDLCDVCYWRKRAESPWMPIETAPKDRTVVDIWRDKWGGERLADMRFVDLGKGNVFYEPDDGGAGCVRDATHWMHPPKPPESKE